MSSLVIIGAGGHARVLVEALKARGLTPIGFVTREPEKALGIMAGIPRIGDDDSLLAGGAQGVILVNGVGSVGDPKRRQAAFETFRAKGFNFALVIHPSAVIASDVVLAEGAQIMAGAVLQPGVRVGVNAIVNTGAIVDHDVMIGNHAHIAPNACLAGNVTVGDGTHIGASAIVIQNVHINERVLVAAGAVVIGDIPAGTTSKGNPARSQPSD